MPRVAIETVSRFPMQIPPPMKARLLRAAAIENTSLKDFMLSTAMKAADEVLERAERVYLNEKQSKFLLDLLDNPPKPTAKSLAAISALKAQE